eukprot:gnl/MRDRNA2_/MRDRNA2_19019_c0_seq1.p1 gnl/MRDRNA2_/MRDRNA2_19019_c0~~gnl/MRDRNA2_/MRDRNA2_19019_c0_seq1.p1  ORF type:complete len:235 (-),score=32.81 gnl/MRDRNA2_/MRDRNA2_19019_c0_seq1:19-723(-)
MFPLIMAPPGLEATAALLLVHAEANFAFPSDSEGIYWMVLEAKEAHGDQCCARQRTPVVHTRKKATPKPACRDVASGRNVFETLLKSSSAETANDASANLRSDATGLATSALLAACRSMYRSRTAATDVAHDRVLLHLANWQTLLLSGLGSNGHCLLHVTILWQALQAAKTSSCSDPQVIGTSVLDLCLGPPATTEIEILGGGSTGSLKVRTEFRGLQSIQANAVWQTLFSPGS